MAQKITFGTDLPMWVHLPRTGQQAADESLFAEPRCDPHVLLGYRGYLYGCAQRSMRVFWSQPHVLYGEQRRLLLVHDQRFRYPRRQRILPENGT